MALQRARPSMWRSYITVPGELSVFMLVSLYILIAILTFEVIRRILINHSLVNDFLAIWGFSKRK